MYDNFEIYAKYHYKKYAITYTNPLSAHYYGLNKQTRFIQRNLKRRKRIVTSFLYMATHRRKIHHLGVPGYVIVSILL